LATSAGCTQEVKTRHQERGGEQPESLLWQRGYGNGGEVLGVEGIRSRRDLESHVLGSLQQEAAQKLDEVLGG